MISFYNWKTLIISQKLSKNYEELNDKLIIQYFYHIYIYTLIRVMNS